MKFLASSLLALSVMTSVSAWAEPSSSMAVDHHGFSAARTSSVDYFKSVLHSQAFQNVAQRLQNDGCEMKGIAHTATYRCIGCFGYTVTFEHRQSGEQRQVVFETRRDFESDAITVTAHRRGMPR